MTTTGSATAFAKSADSESRMNFGKRLLLWLESWYQVLIAELLYVLDRRGYSRAH